MARAYSVIDSRAVSTAITVLQVTAPATATVEILRAWVTQSSSTTSAQADVVLLRKTATVTGGTTITPLKMVVGSAVAATTAVRTATGEGTDGDILAGEGFNVLNGWLHIPVPEERIFVPPSGMLALKFPTAPPNVTYRYGIVFREIG